MEHNNIPFFFFFFSIIRIIRPSVTLDKIFVLQMLDSANKTPEKVKIVTSKKL
jgi:hypothetical protein